MTNKYDKLTKVQLIAKLEEAQRLAKAAADALESEIDAKNAIKSKCNDLANIICTASLYLFAMKRAKNDSIDVTIDIDLLMQILHANIIENSEQTI